MIFKSYLLEKNIDQASSCKMFLFYGENEGLKKEFKEKLKTDTAFAKSPEKQLDYIYKKTDHYESAHLRLPIFKIFK